MKLTKTDEKLLGYLYHNHNEPLTQIAKNTKLTRAQVEYRLKKYEEKNLIRKYFPVLDYAKLGYNKLVFLLVKFETPNMTDTYQKQLEQDKNTISYGKTHGKYDLYLNCIFKDEIEMNQRIAKLFEQENMHITKYLLIQPSKTILYPLKFFNIQEKEKYDMSTNTQEIDLDKKEQQLLKNLSEDSRTKLVDLARKTNITPQLAHHKLKKLRKEIIHGNRIQFNTTIMGYYHTMILLNFTAFTKKKKEQLRMYAEKNMQIQTLIFNIHKPHCAIQLLYKEEKTLRQHINELKDLFYEEYTEIELLLIEQETQPINPVPFL